MLLSYCNTVQGLNANSLQEAMDRGRLSLGTLADIQQAGRAGNRFPRSPWPEGTRRVLARSVAGTGN